MERPATLNCFVNNVSPVTVVIPANVANSATFNTSKSVCPSTSRLSLKTVLPTIIIPVPALPLPTLGVTCIEFVILLLPPLMTTLLFVVALTNVPPSLEIIMYSLFVWFL